MFHLKHKPSYGLKASLLLLTLIMGVGASLALRPVPVDAQKGASPCAANQWKIDGQCYSSKAPCSNGSIFYKNSCITEEEAAGLVAAEGGQTQPPGCEGMESEQSLERCVEAYIADEIREQCGAVRGDEIERCAVRTRKSIVEGDFDYNGRPDDQEGRTSGDTCESSNINKDNCSIIRYLVDFINLLSALVGIIAVIMLTVWGIQYSASRDNPQMVAAARLHILQTLLGLVIFMVTYIFLQWVIPGGVL